MAPKFIAALGMSDYAKSGQALDAQMLDSAARACQNAGFSGLYLRQVSNAFEPMELLGHLAALDLDLDFWVGHRPAAVVPTMSSRMFATLDQLTAGRVSAVLDLGDAQPDGDSIQTRDLLPRAYEYAAIMSELWGADAPCDHNGAFYRFNKARTVVQPLHKAATPVLLAASADQAMSVDQGLFKAVVVSSATLAQIPALVATLRATNTMLVVCLAIDDGAQAQATIAAYAVAGVDTFVLSASEPIQDVLKRHPTLIAF